MELTVEEYKRLCIDERMSDKEILRQLHYSPKSKSVLRKWKAKHNVPLGRSRIYLATPEEVQRDAECMSIEQIADKYIVSEPTVRVYLKEHNISYQKKGEIIMSKKKPRIVVDYIEGEGVRSRVDHAYSREHAIWMLAQAIITITTPEQPEVAEVTEHETLPELSDEDKQQPEKDKVPNVLQ